jgi:hypothetical protein
MARPLPRYGVRPPDGLLGVGLGVGLEVGPPRLRIPLGVPDRLGDGAEVGAADGEGDAVTDDAVGVGGSDGVAGADVGPADGAGEALRDGVADVRGEGAVVTSLRLTGTVTVCGSGRTRK